MKNLMSLVCLLSFLYCSKAENSETTNTDIVKNISILVPPNLTDVNYKKNEESHYVVRNTKTHLNKLLLFIGGSFSIPKNYNLICDHAAKMGLDVISLSYPNNVAAASLGTSSDLFIFDNYRDELCFGNQVSSKVNVDFLNCINTRATNLILYLKNTYPDQNWGQYLTQTNNLQWDKIIVSGHSQGSGHACYIGKKKSVNRVVMFSGPNDYSNYLNTAGNWLSITGLTPLSKHYSLLHLQDEIIAFDNQVKNLRALGLLTAKENPILADDLNAPFENAHALSLNIPASSYHSAPIGGNLKLPNIWTYLFISN